MINEVHSLEMLYRFLRCVFYIIYNVFFSAEAYNKENVPKTGGVILAANHLSNWDPMLISCFFKRTVGYMAKQELFDVPIFGPALLHLHSFPVKRGAMDIKALRTAMQKLKAGDCIGVFPEGHRSKTGQLQQGSTGVAFIAAKSGAPVIPVAVFNTNNIFHKGSFFAHIKVAYGEPIYYSGKKVDKQSLQAFTVEIMRQIQNLINFYKT